MLRRSNRRKKELKHAIRRAGLDLDLLPIKVSINRGPRHRVPKEGSRGGRHAWKLNEQRRGEPRDHTHPWILKKPKPVIDRRAEAVAFAKKRREEIREMREDIPKLRALFDEERIRYFEGEFGYYEKERLGDSMTEREIEARHTRQALESTFGESIVNLYGRFLAETRKFEFADFQQWAKKKMVEAEQALEKIR